jgi:hypothetical protein
MRVTDWVKIQGLWSLNRPTNSTDETIKCIQDSQFDNEVAVIVNANHEVNDFMRFSHLDPARLAGSPKQSQQTQLVR